MDSPLYNHLKKYAEAGRISFAMPGHKNGRGLKNDLLALDVTELDRTENLHNPGEYIRKSHKLLSALYGSDKSYIVTGGSTAAIQAMICSAVKPGGVLLCAADCHMSVINTCSLVGIKIRIFPKQYINDFAVPAGQKTIDEYITDDVDAVIITSPNYYGICSDIKNISEECHKRKIPLLVDEAHGAHFVSDRRFPETAVKYADAVCQSAHKTLNAMNGSAYLHLNSGYINMELAERALYAFQSSSPSYVIAASADVARAEIEQDNSWGRCIDLCAECREKIKKIGISVLDNDDITRLVLRIHDFGINGFFAEKMLADKGIDIEMADLFNIVLIVTPSNTKEDLKQLCDALKAMIQGKDKVNSKFEFISPKPCGEILCPQKAFFADRKAVDLQKSAGYISCVTVVAYPPGIPVIYTGETIVAEQTEYLMRLKNAGAEISGLEDGQIYVME